MGSLSVYTWKALYFLKMNKPIKAIGISKMIILVDLRFDFLLLESGDLQLFLTKAFTASTSTSQSGHPKQWLSKRNLIQLPPE